MANTLYYTYDPILGKMWADNFTDFCVGLRDFCGLDVDPQRSHIMLSNYYQEYMIDGKLHGVDRDGMPEFLAKHGVPNDVVRSRATPSNWELYLTDTDGLEEKYDRLLHKAMKGKFPEEEDLESVVEETLVSLRESVAKVDVDEVAETAVSDEVVEVTEDQVIMKADIVETEVETQATTSDVPAEPDFEYAKTLETKEALQEYADLFGIKLGGKAMKGHYLSFTNQWAKMKKESK